MWESHKMEEDWGFLLIKDASNAFNEQNRTGMLWTVRHEWPSGARFTYNCYKHGPLWWLATTTAVASFFSAKKASLREIHF
jgi:hypothetical protein